MLAIKSDTRYRLKQKESNTQRFERNLLKQSKKASHVLLTPLPFQFYFPPQFFLFPFSTILLFSLLNVFIPSSVIFIIFPPSFYCFHYTSTTTTTATFLLFSLHHLHHHHCHISVVFFPPPPPPPGRRKNNRNVAVVVVVVVVVEVEGKL